MYPNKPPKITEPLQISHIFPTLEFSDSPLSTKMSKITFLLCNVFTNLPMNMKKDELEKKPVPFF